MAPSSASKSNKTSSNSNDSDNVVNSTCRKCFGASNGTVALKPCHCRLCPDCLVDFLVQTRLDLTVRCAICHQPVSGHVKSSSSSSNIGGGAAGEPTTVFCSYGAKLDGAIALVRRQPQQQPFQPPPPAATAAAAAVAIHKVPKSLLARFRGKTAVRKNEHNNKNKKNKKRKRAAGAEEDDNNNAAAAAAVPASQPTGTAALAQNKSQKPKDSSSSSPNHQRRKLPTAAAQQKSAAAAEQSATTAAKNASTTRTAQMVEPTPATAAAVEEAAAASAAATKEPKPKDAAAAAAETTTAEQKAAASSSTTPPPTKAQKKKTRGKYGRRQTFEERVEALLQYKAVNGDLWVPYGFPPDPGLGEWCKSVRSNQIQLSPGQRRVLAALGFSWEPKRRRMDRAWDQMCAALQKFAAQHGHCRVPPRYAAPGLETSLHHWILTQRRQFRKNQLRPDRLRRLREVAGLDLAPGKSYAEQHNFRYARGRNSCSSNNSDKEQQE